MRQLRPVIVISRDVVRAASKERMMYGFLLLALLFILMANVPFFIDDPRVLQGMSPEGSAVSIGFSAINLFTLLIAIFACVSTLQGYLARERLILLLSKPVKRWQVLEGVALGLFEIIFMNWCLMTGGLWLVVVSGARVLGTYVWAGMSITALLALFYVSLVVFLYCLVPNVVAGVLALLFIIAGFGASLTREMFLKAEYPVYVKQMLLLGLKALPDINTLLGLSMRELGFFHARIAALPLIAHTLLLCVLLNLFSCLKFRRFFQSL